MNAQLQADEFDTSDTARLEAELQDEKELTATLRNTLATNVRDGGISRAFKSSGANETQLRSAQAIAKDTVMVGGELKQVISVDNFGQSEFRHSTTGRILQNTEGNFGYSDWLKHLAENEGLPLYAKPKSQSATSDANQKRLVKSKMSQADKQKFKAENGIPAYNALPFS